MAHEGDTGHIIVGQPEIQAIVLGLGTFDLHVAGALFGDDPDTVGRGTVIHVHRHVAGQVEGGDLHAAGRREDQGIVAHRIVGHLLAARGIGVGVIVHELALLRIPVIEVCETALVERVHAIAAVQVQRTEHVIDHILVEAFARDPFQDGTGHIEVEVAVLVAAAARLIVVIAFAGIGIDIRVDDVDGGPIAQVVIDARRVGKQHLQRDRGIGELGIPHLETDQVAHVVGQLHAALFDLLEQAGGGERLGDGGDAEDRLVIHRLLCREVFHPEIMMVNDLVVLHDGAADADGFDFSKICFHIFFKFLFGLLAAGKQQGGHKAGSKKAFFHFFMVLSVLLRINSTFLSKILLQR